MRILEGEQGFVDVGHCQLAFRRAGDGPNMLFVHGWPLNGDTWRNVVRHVEGFTTYVIDLPGTGDSKVAPKTPLTIQSHVDAVVKVIDELALDDVVLVGQDSGGMICRFVAEQRPNLVRALSLCGTEIPGVHPPAVALFSMLAKAPGALTIFKVSLGNRLLSNLPFVLGGTIGDRSLRDGEFRTSLLDPILNDDDAMSAAVRLIQGFSSDDVDALADTHANLTMPTLLVWGEDDPFFPVEKARAMTAQFVGPTKFVTIPKARLFVHEEFPKRFADLTCEFAATAKSRG